MQLTRSQVVELNHAVAIAQAGDPERALAIVERLELDGYSYLYSTRGELLARLGRADDARGAFAQALALARSEMDRSFLRRRIAGL